MNPSKALAPHRLKRIPAVILALVLLSLGVVVPSLPAAAADSYAALALAAEPANATVSGTVTGPDSTGKNVALAEVSVFAYRADGSYGGSASTDSSGAYTLTELAAGSYTLQFQANGSSGSYLAQWWNNKPTQTAATYFAVTAGQKITGNNAVLSAGATISGTVTGPDSTGKNVAVAGISVNAVRADGSHVGYASTDSSGAYTITGVATGSYTLDFQASNSSGSYVEQWWNNQPTQTAATYFAVTAGQKITGDNAALAVGATISGTVTGPDSTGKTVALANVFVSAYRADGPSAGYSFTDSTGAYMIRGLAAGSYTLDFVASNSFAGQWWNNKPTQAAATYFSVTAGQKITGNNAVLAAGATISGTVTGPDSTGKTVALAGISVNAYRADGSSANGSYTGNSASTDNSGAYTLTGLASGSYTLQFQANGSSGSYLAQWWNNKPTQTAATYFAVTAGQKITGNNAVLAVGATISGTVTGPDSTGKTVALAGISVFASQAGGSGAGGSYGGNASTDSSGKYTITGLAAGSYTLNFRANGSSASYLEQWWNNKPTQSAATYFAVTSGQKITGDNAVLAVGATISGTVTGPDSTGKNVALGSVFVSAYRADGSGAGGSGAGGSGPGGSYSGSVSTDSSGAYTITGLAAGSYTLNFRANGSSGSYLEQWWNNKPTQTAATFFTVTAGQKITGDNAVLAVGATISGTVTGPDSTGKTVALANVSVTAYRAAGSSADGSFAGYASTDSSGKYTITGLAAGSYTLNFRSYNSSAIYAGQWWNNKPTQTAATYFAVSSGQKITGDNAVLVVGATILGTVTGPDSTGKTVALAGISVFASQAGGSSVDESFVGYAATDSSGKYTITGLATGSYTLNFRSYNSSANYGEQWWNNKPTRTAATYFAVTAGQKITGNNAVLAVGATVSGTVTGPDSTGKNIALAGISVYASQAGGSSVDESFAGYAATDSSGKFTITGLAAGNYTLDFRVDGASGNYAEQWWNNKPTRTAATYFAVSTGQKVTGNNAVLAVGSDTRQ